MQYRVLGNFEVWSDGGEVALGAPKQRALLAALVLHANELVSVDRLIDDLWGERPPASAAKVVQVYVSQLRKALGSAGREAIVTRPCGYLVRLDPEQLDAYRFERLLADGRKELSTGHAAEAAAKLEEALGLWRGRALADFAYEPFAQAAIARLEELRLVATEERIDAGLSLGRHADLVGELEGLAGDHPLRERFRAQLMLALYRSGRQAEALEAYQVARRALVDELGIDPGRSLQELEKAILRQEPALELAEASPRVVPATGSEREAPNRTILVVSCSDGSLSPLVALAEPMTKGKATAGRKARAHRVRRAVGCIAVREERTRGVVDDPARVSRPKTASWVGVGVRACDAGGTRDRGAAAGEAGAAGMARTRRRPAVRVGAGARSPYSHDRPQLCVPRPRYSQGCTRGQWPLDRPPCG